MDAARDSLVSDWLISTSKAVACKLFFGSPSHPMPLLAAARFVCVACCVCCCCCWLPAAAVLELLVECATLLMCSRCWHTFCSCATTPAASSSLC